MKKMLIGLVCLLTTVSVFANEYESAKFSCNVTGDQSSISSIELQGLATENSFDLEIISVKESGRVVKIKQSDDSIVQVSGAKRSIHFSKYFNLEFKKMNKKQAKAALEGLGAVNVPKLPSGLKFPSMFIENHVYLSFDSIRTVRAQVHFGPNDHDGLSYHINIACKAVN